MRPVTATAGGAFGCCAAGNAGTQALGAAADKEDLVLEKWAVHCLLLCDFDGAAGPGGFFGRVGQDESHHAVIEAGAAGGSFADGPHEAVQFVAVGLGVAFQEERQVGVGLFGAARR